MNIQVKSKIEIEELEIASEDIREMILDAVYDHIRGRVDVQRVLKEEKRNVVETAKKVLLSEMYPYIMEAIENILPQILEQKVKEALSRENHNAIKRAVAGAILTLKDEIKETKE